MGTFDYSAEAALFSVKRTNFRQKGGLEYRRFVCAAEAIRFAVEELPSNVLRSCALEVDADRYVGSAIRRLYESEGFPLPRLVRM